jgi:hypothetical protein
MACKSIRNSVNRDHVVESSGTLGVVHFIIRLREPHLRAMTDQI